MRRFPAPIHNVISVLTKLPGVGPKTALRYTFALLRLPRHDLTTMARAIEGLQNIQTCSVCFRYSEDTICDICRDLKRDTAKLCVVADSPDVSTIEATDAYHGHYFVLGGRIIPVEGFTPDKLHVEELLKKVRENPSINEVILAFSPDVHGETTILYLSKRLKEIGIKTTRLARGLPIGADIEYTDEVTLGDALLGRRET